MTIQIPNFPQMVGKVVGTVLHVPVDVYCGVKEGFTGKPCAISNKADEIRQEQEAKKIQSLKPGAEEL